MSSCLASRRSMPSRTSSESSATTMRTTIARRPYSSRRAPVVAFERTHRVLRRSRMIFTEVDHHEFRQRRTRRRPTPEGKDTMSNESNQTSKPRGRFHGRRRGLTVGLAGGLLAGRPPASSSASRLSTAASERLRSFGRPRPADRRDRSEVHGRPRRLLMLPTWAPASVNPAAARRRRDDHRRAGRRRHHAAGREPARAW